MKKFHRLLLVLILIGDISSCRPNKNEQETKQRGVPEKSYEKYNKIISDSTNTLTGVTENIEAEYTIWGCACPNWIETKNNSDNDSTKNYLKLHFYIEPAKPSISIPTYFEPYRHKVKLTGQFYEKDDYPKGTVLGEEELPKARVFRYTDIEVVNNPEYRPDSKIETLTLIYNAISCSCAQWSEWNSIKDSENNQRYWLEADNKNLIDADSLFNGENLPVIIKVTGQIVSKNGFPKIDLTKVGLEEAGYVFKYSKIVVLKKGLKKTNP